MKSNIKDKAVNNMRSRLRIMSGWPPIISLATRLFPRLTIFTYHWVGNMNSTLLSGQHSVPVEEFEAQIAYLARNRLVVGLDEIAGAVLAGDSLGNCVAITFDDAFACVVETVQPILLKYNIPATIFVPGGLIDNKRVLWRHGVRLLIESGYSTLLEDNISALDLSCQEGRDYRLEELDLGVGISSHTIASAVSNAFAELGWNEEEIAQREQIFLTTEQLRQLSHDIWTLGNHSWSHPVLATLDRDSQESEIRAGARFISQFSELARPYFAIPYGRMSDHYCEQTLEAAAAANMIMVLTMDEVRLKHPLASTLGRITPPQTGNDFPAYVAGTNLNLYYHRIPQTIRKGLQSI